MPKSGFSKQMKSWRVSPEMRFADQARMTNGPPPKSIPHPTRDGHPLP